MQPPPASGCTSPSSAAATRENPAWSTPSPGRAWPSSPTSRAPPPIPSPRPWSFCPWGLCRSSTPRASTTWANWAHCGWRRPSRFCARLTWPLWCSTPPRPWIRPTKRSWRLSRPGSFPIFSPSTRRISWKLCLSPRRTPFMSAPRPATTSMNSRSWRQALPRRQPRSAPWCGICWIPAIRRCWWCPSTSPPPRGG